MIFQQKVAKLTKTSKKITHFTIPFRSKNLTHFTNLSSLDIESNMLSQYSQKNFWIYKFSGKHVCLWCQKKYLHYSISWRPGTAFLKQFEIEWLYISLYLRKKTFLQTRSKVLLVGDGIEECQIISLRLLAVWALQNVLRFLF